MDKEIKVSILCTVYNHEKYIEKALQGFVSQKTNFSFEVLIHDDASTDHSRKIIQLYQDQYPDIIVPIYQKENQYSQGKKIMLEFLYPLARGKYIAFCEGDDFWIDNNKLQVQYDFMEKNEDYALCVTKAIKVNEEGKYVCDYNDYCTDNIDVIDLPISDVIKIPNLFPYASMFFRKKTLEKNEAFLSTVPCFDYCVKDVFATDGRVGMICSKMVAYRVGAIGSWSLRVANDHSKYANHLERSIDVIQQIDEYRDFRYHEAFEADINRRFLELQYDLGHWKEIINDKRCRKARKTAPFKLKIRYFLRLIKCIVKK